MNVMAAAAAAQVEHARMHSEFDNNVTFTACKWRVHCRTKTFFASLFVLQTAPREFAEADRTLSHRLKLFTVMTS